ncbi:hypothetical protein BH10PLA2_BH10PLA2_26940 [soil metagenome]
MDGTIRVDRLRLEEMMKLRGVNFAELAQRMEMHYNGALRIKQTQSTSLEGLAKLCNALKCHPFDLVVAEGFPAPFFLAQVSH